MDQNTRLNVQLAVAQLEEKNAEKAHFDALARLDQARRRVEQAWLAAKGMIEPEDDAVVSTALDVALDAAEQHNDHAVHAAEDCALCAILVQLEARKAGPVHTEAGVRLADYETGIPVVDLQHDHRKAAR